MKKKADKKGDYIGEKARENNSQFIENSALLIIWSLIIINEATIRFIETVPSTLPRDVSPSPYLAFSASLLQLLYGLVGLFIGVTALVFKTYSTLLIRVVFTVQFLCSTYVFSIHSLLLPIFRIRAVPESERYVRVVEVFAMLTGINFHAAVHGGQLIFLSRLVSSASGITFDKLPLGNVRRCILWNANVLAAGVWNIVIGVLVNTENELNVFDASPQTGSLASFSIVTGLLMVIWAACGMGIGKSKVVAPPYFIGSAVVYVFMVLNYGILQVGTVGDATFGGQMAVNNGAVFCMALLPALFVVRIGESEESVYLSSAEAS